MSTSMHLPILYSHIIGKCIMVNVVYIRQFESLPNVYFCKPLSALNQV